MVFCIEKWQKQEQINTEHGDALKKIEESLSLKDHAISRLAENDMNHDHRLKRHDEVINSLTECVNSIKDSNEESKKNHAAQKDYHDKNIEYIQIIVENMITAKVFSRNVKWLAGLIVALTVIWKAFEALIQ